MQLNQKPYYQSKLGSAYLANSLNLIKEIPNKSIDLICTSPPFAGSNMTGKVAETLNRKWIAIEIEEEYIKRSQLRFEIN